MASAPSKLYSGLSLALSTIFFFFKVVEGLDSVIADDVSLVVVLLDTNPFFWTTSSFPFSHFLSHVLAFLNAILTLNQLNQVVIIATGCNSCDYVYDSSKTANQSFGNGRMPTLCATLLQNLEEFMTKDEKLGIEEAEERITGSLLSGSLSMALCYIQRVFRSGSLHPQPRILCLQGSPDGPEQYVAIMNAIFSAQRSMVPIDSCYIGVQNSAFLQQASYITGGVHHKPQQLDGLFQYLLTIFATDLHSRSFLQLPKPVGVDFRASCFCHKNTIDMGYICSVCLSIFCTRHKKCSTCGSTFGQAQSDDASATNRKRKAPDS
ncbi:hypothetical protein Dsin_002545 [Dipteronia sinensis]|uniref:General transcription and DNA repair factor IIH subunit TFB4 n=1 Tax=Dipteronia sinensis TaxID=43782 RepID=A0AAE0EJS8_9ROSI|nr:hypothetical protein Dsin_002545 [Dipteronia sinensis]